MKIQGILLLSLALSSPVSAKVYQCIKNGQTYFSDIQCEGERQELDIRVDKPATNVSGTTYDRQKKYLDSINEEREFEKTQAEAEAKIAKTKAEECKRLQDSLLSYQGPGLVYEVKDGQRVYLSDKQRAEDTQKLQKEIQEKCAMH